MSKDQRVAYIMSRFPGFSETFILREMYTLDELGWHLESHPLIFQNEAVVHDKARNWILHWIGKYTSTPKVFDPGI